MRIAHVRILSYPNFVMLLEVVILDEFVITGTTGTRELEE